MPEHCHARRAVIDRNGCVRRQYVTDGDLCGAADLDDSVSDECLVHSARHYLADDCGGDVAAVRGSGDRGVHQIVSGGTEDDRLEPVEHGNSIGWEQSAVEWSGLQNQVAYFGRVDIGEHVVVA